MANPKEAEVVNKIEQILRTTFTEMQATLPHRTGKMANVGCKFIVNGQHSFKIIMDESSVPYARYVDKFYPGFWTKFLHDYKARVLRKIRKQLF